MLGFNPGVAPMAPAVIEHGPEALRAIAAADGMALEAALAVLGAVELDAPTKAAQFLEDCCRITAKNRSW
jgi:hypothetical protein